RALRFVLGGLDDAAGRSSDVERPHRELGARLADGLRGDDADRLAQLGQAARAEVAAVTHHAHAALRLAAERGPDTDGLDTGVLQPRTGHSLPGAVSRGEVCQHREAFAEVRRDGRFADLARGLGHEASHAGQLADLLAGAAGARVGHHVDGVELATLLTRLEL